MGLMTFFGALFLVFSLPFAVFLVMIRRSAKLLIVTVAGAFVLLLAFLCASVVWVAIPPLKDTYGLAVVVGVAFQELFRYWWWKLLKRSEKGLNTLSADGQVTITREKMALASGLGFATMNSILLFNIPLQVMAGPGTLESPGCTNESFFLISALTMFAFTVLNILWTLIAYDGYEKVHDRGSVSARDWRIFYVLLSHLFASLLTLSNEEGGACAVSLVPVFLLTGVTGALAWTTLNMQLNLGRHHGTSGAL